MGFVWLIQELRILAYLPIAGKKMGAMSAQREEEI